MQQSSRHPFIRIAFFLLSANIIIRLLILLIVPAKALAEPFLGFDTSTKEKPPITLSQVEVPATPTDFKSLVKSKGEKNRQALSEKFQEELSKQPPPALPQAGPATAAPLPSTPPPIPGTETSVSQTAPQATVGTPTPPAPAFSASPPGASPPASTDFGTQAPPAQPGEGVYTGFGAGGGGTTQGAGAPPPPPIPSSGGWNIKY